MGNALARLGHSVARVKIWGLSIFLKTEIWSLGTVDLGGHDLTPTSP